MKLRTDLDRFYDALSEDDAGPTSLIASGIFAPFTIHAGWDPAIAALEASHAPGSAKPRTGGGGGGGGGTVPTTEAFAAYAGPSFDSVAKVSGYYMIPPDSTLAVSGSTVVAMTNGEVELFQRAAVGSNSLTAGLTTSLDAFFRTSGSFDPRAVFDGSTGKFVLAAVDQDGTAKTSHLLIAVSHDDHPVAASDFDVFSFNTAIGGSWADFPQIGLDHAGHVYATVNLFSFSSSSFTGSKVFVFDEATHTLSGALDPNAAGASNFSFTPANEMAALSGGAEWLASYGSFKLGNGDNAVVLDRMTASGLAASYTIDIGRIDQTATYGGFSAPQAGTTKTLDAGDSRVGSAVVDASGHYLYIAATILPTAGPDAGHATAHWMAFDISGASPVLVNQGDISGNTYAPGSNLRSYYASLAVETVNGHDMLAVGFAGSGPANGTAGNGVTYVGYGSAYEVTFDPLATGATNSATHYEEIGGWKVLQAGVAPYVRSFGSGDNRWGDYSGIAADPTDPTHVWALGEYAMATGDVLTRYPSENGRWGTELGLFA